MSATRPAREPRFDHGRRRQAIVRAVLTDIFQARLRPGERLVTQALADRFGVSHTPVREALIELAGIGVVDLLPNRGAVVRRVTARDVRDVCQVRRALECEAARAACGRVGPAELREMEDAIRPLAANDPDAAAAAMADHIRSGEHYWSRVTAQLTEACPGSPTSEAPMMYPPLSPKAVRGLLVAAGFLAVAAVPSAADTPAKPAPTKA